MDFDRSQYKGATISSTKSARQEAENKSSTNSKKRVNFHKIEEGVNIFRIAPPHDPLDPPFQPLRTSWLNVSVPEYDSDGNIKKNNKGVPITEVKSKKIFIATVHSDTLKKDPIELYVEYGWKQAEEQFDDKEDRKTYMKHITGFMIGKKFQSGIRPSTNYVYYTWKNGDLGRSEFYPIITKKMEELSMNENADKPIDIDIFSDPDDGYSLKVEYDKSAGKGEKYKIFKVEFNPLGLDPTEIAEAYSAFQEKHRLTDIQLEEWSKKEPLKKLYRNVYTMRDFDYALDGLKRFDDEHDYKLFQNEDFLTELEELSELVPEPEEKKDEEGTEESANETTTTVTKVTKVTDEKETVVASWSKIKCTAYIKAYAIENYGVNTELPNLSLPDSRKWAQLAIDGKELPFPEEVEAPEPTQEKVEEKVEPTVEAEKNVPRASKSRIDEIREKLNKGK